MQEITGSVKKDSIPFFFQLYVNKDRKASEALLKDAEKNGIKGVWFTIDGPVQGKRGMSYLILPNPPLCISSNRRLMLSLYHRRRRARKSRIRNLRQSRHQRRGRHKRQEGRWPRPHHGHVHRRHV